MSGLIEHVSVCRDPWYLVTEVQVYGLNIFLKAQLMELWNEEGLSKSFYLIVIYHCYIMSLYDNYHLVIR